LEFNTFLAGMIYPTGKNTRAGTGTGTGKILYPRVYMGNPTGIIFFDGYGYGMVLSDGYVPVAIPKRIGYTIFRTLLVHNTVLQTHQLCEDFLLPGSVQTLFIEMHQTF
jgi:hypothetical protein